MGELSKVELHVLWRETTRRLESLLQAVRESKRVDEASNFCRWLRFSGIIALLIRNPSPAPILVDGAAMERLVTDILYECGELYRGGKHNPRYAQSDIAEINRKLDILAAHVAQVIPLTASRTECTVTAAPVVTVLPDSSGEMEAESAGGASILDSLCNHTEEIR